MTVPLATFNPQKVSLGYDSLAITVLTVDEPNALAFDDGSVSP